MSWGYNCRNDNIWRFEDDLAGIESFADPSPLGISRSMNVRIGGIPKRERGIVRDVSASVPRFDLAEVTDWLNMREKSRCLRVPWPLRNELDWRYSCNSCRGRHANQQQDLVEYAARLAVVVFYRN